MNHTKIIKVAKYFPALLAGAFVGAISVYGVGQYPLLVEVNWGAEENRIKVDSRGNGLCKMASIIDFRLNNL
jgi:hypothetical protein